MTKRTSETDERPQEATRQSTSLTSPSGWLSKPVDATLDRMMERFVAAVRRQAAHLGHLGVEDDDWSLPVPGPEPNLVQILHESDPREEHDEAGAEQRITLILVPVEAAHQRGGTHAKTERAIERNPDPPASIIILRRPYQTDPGGEEKIGRFWMRLATKRLTSLPPLVDLEDDWPSVSDLIAKVPTMSFAKILSAVPTLAVADRRRLLDVLLTLEEEAEDVQDIEARRDEEVVPFSSVQVLIDR